MIYVTAALLAFICLGLLAIHGALNRITVALEVIAGLYITAMTESKSEE